MEIYCLVTKYLYRDSTSLIRPYPPPNKFKRLLKKTIIVALDINSKIFMAYMAI